MAISSEPASTQAKGLKHRVAAVLSAHNEEDELTRWVNLGLLALISLNGVALILETVASIQNVIGAELVLFERFSVAVFSVEYVLRVWSADARPGYSGAIRGRLKYMRSPMAIIDLVAILPFYLPRLGIDLRSARMVRLFRFFRLVKLARYSKTLQVFGRVLRQHKEELVTVLALLFLLLVVASTILYYAEHSAQPTAFSSIPASMWWAIATLTTVGYGDMFPITPIGQVLAATIAILGIGVFALPAGILGSAFMEESQRNREREDRRCPHCDGEL